ncbi:MAG TPA: class I SAM-dependent methyltransferase [Pyrinomonadaceae bacterium]|nr:class I SAM-dependent methyltransferase [Pyrinomonadaceae bacterium]
MPFSFRDPSGFLTDIDRRIIRFINKGGSFDLLAFLQSDAARRLTEAGRLVRTRPLDEATTRELVAKLATSAAFAGNDFFKEGDVELCVEHERIPFRSFPYEWPPEMLHAAARLTLDIAEIVLEEGFGLKDASAHNLLFRGPRPVFVDLLSFERRDPLDATWLAYAQFVRTFLLPLLVADRFNLRAHQFFASEREGLEPEDVYRLCGPLQRLRPPFLSLVALPKWLSRKESVKGKEIYQTRRLKNPAQARFILEQLFKRLRRDLARVRPKGMRDSAWAGYMGADKHFTPAYFDAKNSFVDEQLSIYGPREVLDVGCNVGHFSLLAARRGARVVAIDLDDAVVGEVWRRASQEKLDVLPLVVNLAQPSPGTGWRNAECASFLDRARRSFDAVLMLSVVHHMMVTERVPLPLILELAAELTTDLLIVEFIPPDDPMFRRIARGRDELFAYLTQDFFESACLRHFEIADARRLDESSRRIYALRRKGARP